MKHNGSIQRFKAKFVARGFKRNVPVARFDSIRTILSITSNKMYLQQFDVKIAFLQG